MVFPVDDFLARFPSFSSKEKVAVIESGNKAMMHITPDQPGMPMRGKYRFYALFLMTAHLLELDDATSSADGTSIAGTPFKATVGSVTIENTKPNSFQSDDWNYWLNQTKYGRELLAYLEVQAPAGIFLNEERDSVRDLV
jgi:hypothetical protein